jgi:hypothetical protein
MGVVPAIGEVPGIKQLEGTTAAKLVPPRSFWQVVVAHAISLAPLGPVPGPEIVEVPVTADQVAFVTKMVVCELAQTLKRKVKSEKLHNYEI